MSPTLLITVVGPTAIGKTRWAVSLAKHYNTEVISADSRQFFKEMSIGTAAPTVEEQDGVPHHFVHHLSVEQPYSVGDFEQHALNLIAERSADHSVLIMAGGTGGHIYPALAVVTQLRTRLPELELRWLGGRRGLEQDIVPAAGVHIRAVQYRTFLDLCAAGDENAVNIRISREKTALMACPGRWPVRSRPSPSCPRRPIPCRAPHRRSRRTR